MFNLYDYEFKNIRLTDIDGKVWEGKSDAVTSANDNDDTEESIAINTKEKPDVFIEFMKSEIKSIELA